MIPASEGAAKKVIASGVPKAIVPSEGKVNASNEEEAIFAGALPKKKSSHILMSRDIMYGKPLMRY